uniref:Uncharacterized protein n=1 Tax=Sphaerodactylus townsendi TaxID=933632 RepID=A0ACB8G3E2_9SAUR
MVRAKGVDGLLPEMPSRVSGLYLRVGASVTGASRINPWKLMMDPSEEAWQLAAKAGSSRDDGLQYVHYNRMTSACHRKCVPPHYKEAELSKGESVCLDRCVAKYLDIHERMGKKLTELSMQDEELMKRMQQGAGTA